LNRKTQFFLAKKHNFLNRENYHSISKKATKKVKKNDEI